MSEQTWLLVDPFSWVVGTEIDCKERKNNANVFRLFAQMAKINYVLTPLLKAIETGEHTLMSGFHFYFHLKDI